MLFSSTTFLFIFLPVVLAAYYLARASFRNFILLAASMFFYAWGEPRYLLIMISIVTVNYCSAILIERYRKYAKLILTLSILIDIGNLIYFKYTNFILENLNTIFDSNLDMLRVIMPIGISFYTFQAMSYLVDVYRKDCNVQKNYYDLMLYITLFPQMIAGPIVKYHDVEQQIGNRETTMKDFAAGLRRFITGLAKKVLIANTMGAVVERIFVMDTANFSTPIAWLGAISYSLQLYYDFSGYSDMAIGLGKMFGFTFLENFNYPYISKSITEFWRRWHISLSTWFKEYLYIPLGGNRLGNNRTYFNLFIVFLATGIWHGASWNFIFWGLWHGFFIILERIISWHKKELKTAGNIAKHLYTILVFIIGWVIFRSDTMTYAAKYILRMFGIGEQTLTLYYWNYFICNTEIIMMAIALICSTPIFRNMINVPKGRGMLLRKILLNAWLGILFVLSSASIADATFNPFIYFRF
jgi:alginate O-acetyltransferase complex protein AlgI